MSAKRILGLMLVSGLAVAATPGEAIYPVGTRFPLMLYSIHTVEEMKEVESAGWNVAHRYKFSPAFFAVVEEAGWFCVAHLQGKTQVLAPPAPEGADTAAAAATAANAEEADQTGSAVTVQHRLRTEEEVAADIRAYAAHDCVAWWDLPEEQRWWRKDEARIVQTLTAWTRTYDPQQRPNYMYMPGHYQAAGIARHVPYLDIIGAGTYTEYSHQPRAWVRWRMEETLRGIEAAGCRVGRDYRNGEKIPIGIPMLFNSGLERMDPITPTGAYHDFWSCIASGARGICVFSFWHRRDLPILRRTWEQGYMRAAANLQAVPGLDQAILFGDPLPLTVEVIKGAPRTATFRPFGMDEDISLPSVNVFGRTHNGRLYVIAVSSQERPVTARISGLPVGVDTLEVFCEERAEGPLVPLVNGAFEESFPWLTVHLYSAALPRP